MPNYRVTGADKTTGIDIVEMIKAATAAEATACAGVRGILVSSVEYVEDEIELPQPMPQPIRRHRRPKYKNEGGPVYAVLSFLWPGLGQLCKGEVGQGILWMLATFIGYVCLIIPGIVLHLMCIVDATKPVKR